MLAVALSYAAVFFNDPPILFFNNLNFLTDPVKEKDRIESEARVLTETGKISDTQNIDSVGVVTILPLQQG